jgi:hypothetical protein
MAAKRIPNMRLRRATLSMQALLAPAYRKAVSIGPSPSLPNLCFAVTSPRPAVMLLLIDFPACVIQSLLRSIPFAHGETPTVNAISELFVLNASLLSGEFCCLPVRQRAGISTGSNPIPLAYLPLIHRSASRCHGTGKCNANNQQRNDELHGVLPKTE